MNKKSFKKSSGRTVVAYSNYRRGTLESTFRIMESQDWQQKSREAKEKRGKQYGPKERILISYQLNNDINDAIAVMNDINNKIGKQAYTEEMIKAWIQEYEDKSKSRDDDDDAR